MIGKIFSHLLGNTGADFEATEDTSEELIEFEEGGWVVVNLPGSTGMKTDLFELGRVDRTENGLLMASQPGPLENLLIEHPSMSVYQMRSGAEEEQEQEVLPMCPSSRISWHLAAWGVPLPCTAQRLAANRARTRAERKKLSRAALCRQNLASMRLSPGERRHVSFKQPCHRLCSY
ncbi:tumor protein p53-inducible nuclear protein 2 [Pungitius pungitius]|uniref:tumor protein p53-inducible nuclear protein 2 n=1 Tax=Pungitius pungitius TaxID=134920 RepID=UPI00188966A1|nr:tumor protein p53-inducible nuclear protein 2 [Pungitius pungitius]